MEEELFEQEKDDVPHDATCPVCGKNYIPAPFHQYKIYGGVRVCSWSCQLRGEREGIRVPHGAPRVKPIMMFDMNGAFVREFLNSAEASKLLMISAESIRKCCRRQTAHAGGYVFRYREEIMQK